MHAEGVNAMARFPTMGSALQFVASLFGSLDENSSDYSFSAKDLSRIAAENGGIDVEKYRAWTAEVYSSCDALFGSDYFLSASSLTFLEKWYQGCIHHIEATGITERSLQDFLVLEPLSFLVVLAKRYVRDNRQAPTSLFFNNPFWCFTPLVEGENAFKLVFSWLHISHGVTPHALASLVCSLRGELEGPGDEETAKTFQSWHQKTIPNTSTLNRFFSPGFLKDTRCPPFFAELRVYLWTARVFEKIRHELNTVYTRGTPEWLQTNLKMVMDLPEARLHSFLLPPEMPNDRATSYYRQTERELWACNRAPEIWIHAREQLLHLCCIVAPRPNGAGSVAAQASFTQTDYEELIGAAKNLSALDKDLEYIAFLINARVQVACGAFDTALETYLSAEQGARYRAGSLYQEILEEALAIASYRERHKELNTLCRTAYLGGYNEHSLSTLEGRLIHNRETAFYRIFPVGFFASEEVRERQTAERRAYRERFVTTPEKKAALIRRAQKADKPDSFVHTLFAHKRSLLTGAVSTVNVDLVRDLLSRGADPLLKEEDGNTPLQSALDNYALKREMGIDPEGTRSLKSILLLLLERISANQNQFSTRLRISKKTPLHSAIQSYDPEIVEMLINRGADIEFRGGGDDQTPLYFALSQMNRALHIKKGYAPFLTHLKEIRGNISVENLTIASTIGIQTDVSLRKYLEDNPLDRTLPKGIFERYQSVADAALSGTRSIIALLLKHGADANSLHTFGFTPFLFSCEVGDEAIVDLLLASKANPERKTPDGYYAFSIAAVRGHYALCYKLLPLTPKAYFSLWTTDDGLTVMHLLIDRYLSTYERPEDRAQIAHLLASVNSRGADFSVPGKGRPSAFEILRCAHLLHLIRA